MTIEDRIKEFEEKYPSTFKSYSMKSDDGINFVQDKLLEECHLPVIDSRELKNWIRSALTSQHQEDTKEICICAAVKSVDGKIFRGQRHSDCMQAILSRHLEISEEMDSQGFITSTGRYVTRVEGRKLQEAAGIKSIDPDGYRGNTLYSEDLY